MAVRIIAAYTSSRCLTARSIIKIGKKVENFGELFAEIYVSRPTNRNRYVQEIRDITQLEI